MLWARTKWSPANSGPSAARQPDRGGGGGGGGSRGARDAEGRAGECYPLGGPVGDHSACPLSAHLWFPALSVGRGGGGHDVPDGTPR